MALLLVSTAVGAPIGTAAAASSTEECSGVDAIIYDMTTIDGFFSMQDKEEHPCSPSHQRDEAIEELKNASAEQEKLDIYNAALAQNANNEVFTDVSDNYLNDSRSIAWMHAESAIANAYANGSSEAVAKSKAKQAIQDYYSTKQANMIERWNVTQRTAISLRESAENQSDISNSYVYLDLAPPHTQPEQNNYKFMPQKTEVASVQLVNGSSHNVVGVRVGDTDQQYQGTGTIASGEVNVINDYNVRGIGVGAPTSDHEPLVYTNWNTYQTRWQKIETLNSDLQSEVDPFVNATWTAFQNDEIRASDVISRNNLMFRYGTDALNNSNQSLYDSTAALSTMGLATPNINSTGSMTVVYNNVSYTGMVLAQEAPNGTWETGTTYNTSNIGGTVLLATTDGQRIDMKGEFRLESMKNQDGDQIEETQATKVVYKTSNTSELLDKMERIAELRAQIEATKPKGGGGGTSTDDGGNGFLEALASFLGISAGAAAVVLLGAGVVVYKVYTP